MQAILKSSNKIIINGADSSEKIVLENFKDLANDKSNDIKVETVLDINRRHYRNYVNSIYSRIFRFY